MAWRNRPAAVPSTRRHRIVAAAAERLAAHQAPRCQTQRARQAVLLQRRGGVVRTAGRKAARRRQDPRQRALVQANQREQRQRQPVVQATDARDKRWRKGRGRQSSWLRSAEQAQFLAEEQQFLNNIAQLRIRPRLAGADHQIKRPLQAGPQGPKRFPRQPPQPGARGGVTDGLGHCEADARLDIRAALQARDQAQVAALGTPAALKHQVKRGLVLQPTATTQQPTGVRQDARRSRNVRRGRRRRRDHFVETVMRRRPLARRRLSTARPFLVAMRARKPWVRRREILLGLPRPFFTIRSSVQGLSRRVPWRMGLVRALGDTHGTVISRTSAQAAGAAVYTKLRKMRVPCRVRPPVGRCADRSARRVTGRSAIARRRHCNNSATSC